LLWGLYGGFRLVFFRSRNLWRAGLKARHRNRYTQPQRQRAVHSHALRYRLLRNRCATAVFGNIVGLHLVHGV